MTHLASVLHAVHGCMLDSAVAPLHQQEPCPKQVERLNRGYFLLDCMIFVVVVDRLLNAVCMYRTDWMVL